ncbi:hypothetical protein ACWESM_06170 [Nocardia sp. NPDC003999]
MRSEWQPWKLSEAGTEIRTRNGEFVSLIDQTVTQIRAAGAHWSGDAYYAAYDRIAGDRDTANKVALDTETLAQTLIDSGTSLVGFRQTLLDKVDEAVAAGFTVSEDWQVTPGPGASDEDGDAQFTYQTAITTAMNELLGTQTDVAAKIEQASGDVSTRAAQLGDGDPLDSDKSADGTDPALALYSNQSDASATDQAAGTPADDSKQSDQTAPASTPQASPIAAQQQSADQTGAENKQDSGESGDGKDKKETADGKDKQDTGDGKNKDTGDGKDKGTGNGSEDKSASTGAASDPNSWKPSDVTSLITSVSQITGNVPTLIESIGKLDDDLDDIIKAGGEAGKGLIEAAGTSAEKFANAVDTIAGTHQTDGTHTDSPSTGDPAGTGTPKQDPAATDPTTGQPAATDPNAKTEDPNAKSTDSKTDHPAGTENSKTDKPNSSQHAETKQDQPASVRQASYTNADSGSPSTAPASASGSPSTAPASTGLLGGISAANRESDPEHTRRVQSTPTPLFETPPLDE